MHLQSNKLRREVFDPGDTRDRKYGTRRMNVHKPARPSPSVHRLAPELLPFRQKRKYKGYV
jgi:hypothetical protein